MGDITKGGLTFTYEDIKVMWGALQQFVDNTPTEEDYDARELGDPSVQRSLAELKQAQEVLGRIEAFIVPVMEGH